MAAITLTQAQEQRAQALTHLTEIRQRGTGVQFEGQAKYRATLKDALDDFKYWDSVCARLGETPVAGTGIQRRSIINA